MSSTRGIRTVTPMTSLIEPVKGDAEDLGSVCRLYRNT
eukprot:COSAG05_NODE_15384_length_371_cov_0.683824_1_plen_38_part_10